MPAVSAVEVAVSVAGCESSRIPEPTSAMVVSGECRIRRLPRPMAKTPALVVRPLTVLEPADSLAPETVSVAGCESSRVPEPFGDGGGGGNAGSGDFLADGEKAGFGGETGDFLRAGGEISLAGGGTEVTSTGGGGCLAVKAEREVAAGGARDGKALDRVGSGGGVKGPLFCVFELTFGDVTAAVGIDLGVEGPGGRGRRGDGFVIRPWRRPCSERKLCRSSNTNSLLD